MTTRNSILRQLKISPEDWVLEIGSGPTPFARSDILADRYIIDNKERAGNFVNDRTSVVCDAHYLPFVDDSFDYIFCSQLLEHLENPDFFFKEIARVGRKGYIETPNEVRERLFGWPFHKWIVDKDVDGLILRENDVEQGFGLLFHKLQLENAEFYNFCKNYFDLLNVSYEWHGEPIYRYAEEGEYCLPDKKVYLESKEVSDIIEGKSINKKNISWSDFIKLIKSKMPRSLKRFMRQNIFSPYGFRHSEANTAQRLKEILACPVCKEKVALKTIDQFVCNKCNRHFSTMGGIPVMLLY